MRRARTIFAGRVQAQITPQEQDRLLPGSSVQLRPIRLHSGCGQLPARRAPIGSRPADSSAVRSLSPEAFTSYADTYQQVRQATWTSTVTAKLLLEAGLFELCEPLGLDEAAGCHHQPEQVTDFGRPAPPFQYRALDDFFNNYQSPNVWRASASYVTGAHNMKFGYQGAYLIEEIEEYADDPQLTYTFFGGVPVSLTQRIAPWDISNRTMYSAFFAQDQWTLKRLTLQGAVRYDRAWSWFPADHNGAPVANVIVRANLVSAIRRRQCLQRHHAANRHGVRPVRQRQDVVPGEHRASTCRAPTTRRTTRSPTRAGRTEWPARSDVPDRPNPKLGRMRTAISCPTAIS